MSFVGVYSGYFGAAAGTLALAILDLGKIGPFHQINALKTVVGFGANISAAIMFICRGSVYWPFAIAMCLGCIIGSSIAPPVTRHIPENIMRAAAVLTGIVLAVKLGCSTYVACDRAAALRNDNFRFLVCRDSSWPGDLRRVCSQAGVP